MKKTTLYLFLYLSLGIALPLSAQFGQSFLVPNHNPMIFNPAFAGSLAQGRMALSLSTEGVPRVPYRCNRFNLAWDQRMDKLKGGVGIMFTPRTNISYYDGSFTFMWSPKFKLGERWSLAPGAGVSVGGYYFDKNLYIDRFSPSLERDITLGFVDLSAGIMCNNRNFFIGIGVQHILQPRIQVLPDWDFPGTLPRTLTLQSGYTYGFRDRPGLSISSQLLTLLGDHLLFQDMISFRLKALILGAGIRYTNDPEVVAFFDDTFILLHAGHRGKKTKLSYTLCTNPVRNLGFPLNTHEFSLIFYFGEKPAETSL